MLDKTRIMGILNVTPDSFYDGGKYGTVDSAVVRAYEIASEGADIIDIGGESTRPGAKPVPASEEIDRICPVIERISAHIGIPVSVDTNKSEVAEAAVKCGASIINDISGLTFDDNMAKVAAKHGAGVVIMHIKGKPETMQSGPKYNDLFGEILHFFNKSVKKALDAGIGRDRIILDPGIGFGKTLEDNYMIVKHLSRFKDLGFPLCVGLSRKSMIGKLYQGDEDRLPATIALNAAAVINGADIIRVHDVREHVIAMAAVDMLGRAS